jgi:hypothetical protein
MTQSPSETPRLEDPPWRTSSLQKEPMTDSPWLWSAVFTAVGLAALIATGGKLGKRQANIENKYQARAAVASGQVEVEARGGQMAARGAPEYSTPEETVIPLWPVKVILGLICAASVVMFVRQRFK